MSWGVIIGRLQPIHNGHIELLRQAVRENDNVLLFVGSADKLDKRNPIPIALRLEMAQEAVNEAFGDDSRKINVIPLNDLMDESNDTHDWGFYLYSHVVGATKSPEFTLYYSDGFEKVMKWFPNFITRDFISFKLNARGAIHNSLSATEVRALINRGRFDELTDLVPRSVVDRAPLLKHFISAFKEK